ncbi:hypothetical protein [Geobacillus subterraneus]|uniref:hypothetical protein n=1 Tax=Geobacillus subterraneus TaxID=129338 RepID=UPI001442D923|nr:hypothetical protein [Geobacillus subterraneus]QIZ65849.1 hypothetical protein HF500_04965 [Geobacillus subterraneus]
MDWSKATIRQLVTIIRFEECPEVYKQRARQEMKQRLGGEETMKKQRQSLHGPVKISYLTPEELEAYRNRPRKTYYDDDNRRIIDWRWPRSRGTRR